jgi:hypothetical protein
MNRALSTAKNGKITALSSFKPCGWHNASARVRLARWFVLPRACKIAFQNCSCGSALLAYAVRVQCALLKALVLELAKMWGVGEK